MKSKSLNNQFCRESSDNDKTRYMRLAERIKNQRQANPRPYTLASYIYGFIRRLAIKDGYL